MRLFALAPLVAIGCSQDAPAVPDAGPDALIDAAPDAGCGLSYTGEYVDWDSTEAAFVGINGATFTVRTDPTRVAMTPPNGRFVMCIPDGNFAVVDITPPGGTDYLPGIAFAKHDVIRATMASSMRSMTVAQRDALFAGAGQTYDPTNSGQILVHFNGTVAHKATVGNTPVLTVARNTDAWAAGDTGNYVFFGNVALGATANTVVTSDAAGVVGTASVPLSPGFITYVELFVP